MTEPLNERDEGESGGLYLDWESLRREINPRLGRDRFRALIKEKQARGGFPPFDEEWGGFYWPRVKEWLDSQNRVGAENAAVAHVEDGQETFDATPRKKARLQDRPAQAAVLDRQPGHARPDGVSRHLYSVATRGER